MKIFTVGVSLRPEKFKYKDEWFSSIVEKFTPAKETPFGIEFTDSDPERCDAVVVEKASVLDLIVTDLERIENRLARTEDESEKILFAKAQQMLEAEQLLCDSKFSNDEEHFLRQLQLISFKPCLVVEGTEKTEDLIRQVMEKAGMILFFTAGKKEVRAWGLTQGENVHVAAGKIHSDLKRGFIKADIAHAKDLDNFFNMAEARARGFVEIVDKDYIVQANDIIEIKFNV